MSKKIQPNEEVRIRPTAFTSNRGKMAIVTRVNDPFVYLKLKTGVVNLLETDEEIWELLEDVERLPWNTTKKTEKKDETHKRKPRKVRKIAGVH